MYFIANWKQHFTQKDAQNYLNNFSISPQENKEVIISPSDFLLPLLKDSPSFKLAAQNISAHPSGPQTGLTGADQIADLVDYCIIGHSETRRFLNDTDEKVASKASLLLKAGITPIICLDLPYLESQLTVLKHELLDLPDNLIFAYEPLSAIGSGTPDNPQKANEIAFKIKTLTSKSSTVVYGGSVNPENVKEFTTQENIGGVLVGQASLDPDTFAKIILAA